MFSFFASPFSSELYWIGIATTCLGYAGVMVPLVTNGNRDDEASAPADLIANTRIQNLRALNPGISRH